MEGWLSIDAVGEFGFFDPAPHVVDIFAAGAAAYARCYTWDVLIAVGEFTLNPDFFGLPAVVAFAQGNVTNYGYGNWLKFRVSESVNGDGQIHNDLDPGSMIPIPC